MKRFVLLLLILVACAAEPGEDSTTIPTPEEAYTVTENQYEETVEELFPDDVLDDALLECERVGGEWSEFPDSCADNCDFQRNEVDVCAQTMTDSCYCGPTRCWNGRTCEDL